jgi:hypothetical protein
MLVSIFTNFSPTFTAKLKFSPRTSRLFASEDVSRLAGMSKFSLAITHTDERSCRVYTTSPALHREILRVYCCVFNFHWKVGAPVLVLWHPPNSQPPTPHHCAAHWKETVFFFGDFLLRSAVHNHTAGLAIASMVLVVCTSLQARLLACLFTLLILPLRAELMKSFVLVCREFNG